MSKTKEQIIVEENKPVQIGESNSVYIIPIVEDNNDYENAV